MVGYYRLKELGYKLAAGAHVLRAEDVAPLDQAAALLDQARTQAAQIVSDAKAAYQRECERGYADGLAQEKLEAAERLLVENAELDTRLREVERDLVGVVVSSVRKLIDSFDDIARAEAAVRGALKRMRREKKAELRVSPEQLGHFRTAISGIVREFPEVELVDVIEDSSLTAPQVILETAIGRVEGDFGRRLEELENIIRTVATHRKPEVSERATEEAGARQTETEPA